MGLNLDFMRTVKILVVIIVLFSVSSCKNFLDTEPLSENQPDNFYQTESQVVAALAGVYDILGRSETYGNQMLARMALDADEAYSGVTAGLGIENHLSYASDAVVGNNWRLWYDGINRANLLLENIYRADMDSIEREVIRGEALFLRGYYHFMLVKNWGDVPVMIKSIDNPNQVYAERTPAHLVYEQITRDMKDAEKLVKTALEIGHGGKVNKSAVRGILARVYLHWAGYPVNDVSKYEEARDWAYKVMMPDPKDGFQHDLNPSYEDVFVKYCTDQYDIKESIWEIEFYGNGTTDNGFTETGLVGSNNGIRYLGDDSEYGGKYVYSTGIIRIPARTWYTFEGPDDIISPDERRDWSIANYTLDGTPAYETAVPMNTIIGRSSGKWRRELEVVYPKTKNISPNNFPLLRFSDVLLMFAEAENQIHGGPTADAIAAVNRVRRRAYGKDLPIEAIRYIRIDNTGSGYTAAPNVTITGGGGVGAEAQAFVHPTNRRLTHIKVLNQGTGYTSEPVITITGGGGIDGTATAILSQRSSSDYLLDEDLYGTKEDFQILIEEERLRELCFETNRKGDLVRWGKYLEYMERIKNDFVFGDPSLGIIANFSHVGLRYFQNVSRKDLLWPLPMNEMTLNPGLTPQNYGY